MINDTTLTTGSLEVPGARLHYEVRGEGAPLVLVGSPMDAAAFAPAADQLALDHTVVTIDPRGINHSTVDDAEADSTPELRAEDLSRLLSHLDAGPAAIFGSSGGAVTALALVQARPKQVHTVIAHEPPLIELLEDRQRLRAGTDDMIATFRAGDTIGAWSRFMTQANITLPPGALEAMFGGDREPQQEADERFFFAHELRPTTRWQPDVAALRTGPTRVVVGIGEHSTGELCDRTSRALAARAGHRADDLPRRPHRLRRRPRDVRRAAARSARRGGVIEWTRSFGLSVLACRSARQIARRAMR